ncbi:MAG: ACP S-malonyltransferase [Holosporales bacterium]|jgi:[acyl-carrier-protein] S-malonyltransferase|nr:ACP S-malonyltransferase [Holosporales bacterium]
MRAFVFPGQGSQRVGMGQALYEAFPAAREVFERVDAALSESLSHLIFHGPQETLTKTCHAQPALMAVSLAVVAVLEKEGGFSLAQNSAYGTGHSLGEYSALAAFGASSLENTAQLLRLRGITMSQAVPPQVGGMCAVLGLERAVVQRIADKAAAEGVCVLANDNCPGQIVLSGEKKALATATAGAMEQGAKRVIPLEVSAPFHSPMMAPAQETMRAAFAHFPLKDPVRPLISNVTAESVEKGAVLEGLLVQQVTHCVRWTESVLYLAAQGVTHCIEIGAGAVLTGLIRRIVPIMRLSTLNTPKDIEQFLKDNT